MPPSRASLDPRDMKAAYVVSDENGYYDSQNIVSLGGGELSGVLHHSRNHEGGKGGDMRLLRIPDIVMMNHAPGLTLCSTRSVDGGRTWSKLRPIEQPETEADCEVRWLTMT